MKDLEYIEKTINEHNLWLGLGDVGTI